MNSPYPIGAYFKFIHNKFVKHFDSNLKKENLTASQLSALLYITESPGVKFTLKDIGDYLDLKHSTVIGIIGRLESKGFVHTQADSGNKKYKNVLPTEKAFEIESIMKRKRKEMDAILVKGFTPEEEAELRRLLEKVIENLSEI